MEDLDDNLSVRGGEKIGLIGCGHCCAIIDKDAGVSMASFMRYYLKIIFNKDGCL